MIGRGGKRFWTSAAVVKTAGGHAIELDGRPVRTPARALLVLPSRAMADAVAGTLEVLDEAVLARPAAAAPGIRAQSIQRGDFVLFGNTLGHECAAGTPA